MKMKAFIVKVFGLAAGMIKTVLLGIFLGISTAIMAIIMILTAIVYTMS